MPETDVVLFKDDEGNVPVFEWLESLLQSNPRAYKKCRMLIRMLMRSGYELRRPHTDLLRDGIYELRTKVGTVNYRILYGFVGKNVALLASGFTKEKKIPEKQIERAVARLNRYHDEPNAHYFRLKDDENG